MNRWVATSILFLLTTFAARADTITTYTFDHLVITRGGDAAAGEVSTSGQGVTYNAGVGAFPEGGPGVSIGYSGYVIVHAVYNVSVTITGSSTAPSESVFSYKLGTSGTAYASASSTGCIASSDCDSVIQSESAFVSTHNTDIESDPFAWDSVQQQSCSLQATSNPSVFVGQIEIGCGTLSAFLHVSAPEDTYKEATASASVHVEIAITNVTSS